MAEMGQQKTSVSYILAFYGDVLNLSNEYSALVNDAIFLRMNYGAKDFEEVNQKFKSMKEEHQKTVIENVQRFRFWATRCKLEFSALQETYPEFKTKPTLMAYKDIVGEKVYFIPKFESLETFVQSLHDVLASEIVMKAIESANQKLANLGVGQFE